MKTLGFKKNWRKIYALCSKRLQVAGLAIAILVTGNADATAQSETLEIHLVDLPGVDLQGAVVRVELCATPGWPVAVDAAVLDGKQLVLKAAWDVPSAPVAAFTIGWLWLGHPGEAEQRIGSLRWDGGAILIDLADF